jgi:ElaB/YqjD/DUF883 family membrane-anchored ribosome-binding protein
MQRTRAGGQVPTGPENCVEPRWIYGKEKAMEHVSNRNDSQESLKRDFQGTLNDAEELVRMTGEQTGERIAAARTRMRDSLSRGRSELQRMQTQAGDSARRAAYEVDDYVHSNPWKTVYSGIV